MFNGLEAVPAVDSVENKSLRDVMGNKDDGVTSSSLMAKAHSLEEHIHSAGSVYPTGAAGVAVPTAVGAWTLGPGFTEIVPVNTITSPFDLHFVNLEALDDNGVYEVVLYAATTEICRFKVTKNANLDGTMQHAIQTVIIPANTQIQAKAMSSVGNSVATISLEYHLYT